MRKIALGILFCLTSCSLQRLNVQTQVFTEENLASYYVHSPDPRLTRPFTDQRLLIQWRLPASEFDGHSLQLYLKIRYQNHQEEEVIVPLQRRRDFYLYHLKPTIEGDTEKLFSYKVDIRDECGKVLASWTHPLWKEFITFTDGE